MSADSRLFIGGEWRDGGGDALAIEDPSTGETVTEIVRPTADDAKVFMKLFKRSGAIYFDLERKVLIPSDISLG